MTPEDFDIDAFLHDLHSQSLPVSIMAMIHYLWKNHSIKIEPAVTLVALSETLVVDLADVQYIRKTLNDEYLISLKANDNSLYIYPDTSEYEGVVKLIALLALRSEH